MSKKKFDLTKDLVIENKEVMSSREISTLNERDPGVTLTIRVPQSLRSEYKAWCAQENITASEGLKRAFKVLKNREE